MIKGKCDLCETKPAVYLEKFDHTVIKMCVSCKNIIEKFFFMNRGKTM